MNQNTNQHLNNSGNITYVKNELKHLRTQKNFMKINIRRVYKKK